jgi:transposase
MLDNNTRAAVLTLRSQGHATRKIAKDLGISRNSVKEIIASGRVQAPRRRQQAHRLDPFTDQIRTLHNDCRGNLVRVKEELGARHQVQVPYTTLTRFCRRHQIGQTEKQPAMRIVTGPSEEMLHDTSPYNITIGGKRVKRQCASLVFGYSRRMFIQFYERFDRFHCKVFLTDAFRHMGGVCSRCVIDNTHVVIVCGTGKNAQVSPEMEAFEKRFGFYFLAHELGHADRSGKVERPFRYIEGNFLAGRSFKDDRDLNRQAVEWLRDKADTRQIRELGASPRELFAAEQPHLRPLPLYVPEIYRDWRRDVDEYGYVSLHGMGYSAGRKALGKNLTVRETKDEVIVLDGKEELARHPKLTSADGRRQSTLSGHEHRPHRRPPSPAPGELELRALGPQMEQYLNLLKANRAARYYWSLKKLYRLLCQYKASDLLGAAATASQERVFDVRRLEALLLETVAREDFLLPLDSQDYEKNPEFQKGAGTPPSGLDHIVGQEYPQEGENNA